MIVAVVLLSVAVVGLAAALVAQAGQSSRERTLLLDEWAAERQFLVDRVVARHAGDVRMMTLAQAEAARIEESPEVREFKEDRARMLRDMGYEPTDVPGVPHGFDGR